ncbi:MAG TPA: SLC13 family permease [Vicinamibacterales bacterium]
MGWEPLVALLTIILVFYALSRNLASTDVLLMGAATLLMSLSVVSDRFPDPRDFAAAFGNEGLLTVAALFVVSAGLTETGAIAMIAERIMGRPTSVAAAQARVMLPVAGMSAFLNNTPVVAMFMPVISEWSRKIGVSPSKLFIPLSYAAVLGGTCTLIGTSTNLVVQGLMIQAQRVDPGMPVLGMWTLTPVGVVVALAGIGFVLLVSPRLLPERKTSASNGTEGREYTVEMRVEPHSAVDGKSIEAAGLRQLPGAYLAAIERDGKRMVAVGPEEVLRGNDQLMFVGLVDSVVELQRVRGLAPATSQVDKLTSPRPTRRLVEAVVSDGCPIVGMTIREGEFRSRYNAVVIAVHRNGERIDAKIGDIVLRAGDTLLLETHRRFLRAQRNNRDFYLVSDVPGSTPRRHDKAWIALGILTVTVTAMAFERYTHVSVFNAALLAAGAMGITGCLSAEQARHSIDWQTLVAIGAALGIGKAMETTGLAGISAGWTVGWLEPFGPAAVLAGIYVLTLVFTEILTNNAAAALAFPIAHAASNDLGLNFLPFGVAIAIAASAGFATPMGYQTHLMVYGAGGYKFSDYLRVGVPLDLIVMLVTVTMIPWLFPF